jgi:hypothetical protein
MIELSWCRGSVWVEQEIAISAFISQALKRPLHERAYVHENIRREGLRDKLHLNPVLFREGSEILRDLGALLPSWRALTQEKKEPLSLKANIRRRRVNVPGGGDDERYMLLVGIENDGELDATDFRLDVEFPETFLDEGGHMARIATAKLGVALFAKNNKDSRIEHLYPGAEVEGIISFHYAIRGKVKRENPESLQESVRAIVCSGNMKPKVSTTTIAELMD